jgi:hypothetical protein
MTLTELNQKLAIEMLAKTGIGFGFTNYLR